MGEGIIIQTGQVGFAAGQVGFAAGQVDFQVAVETIVEACILTHHYSLNVNTQYVTTINLLFLLYIVTCHLFIQAHGQQEYIIDR